MEGGRPLIPSLLEVRLRGDFPFELLGDLLLAAFTLGDRLPIWLPLTLGEFTKVLFEFKFALFLEFAGKFFGVPGVFGEFLTPP